jgi:hypothetical protein
LLCLAARQDTIIAVLRKWHYASHRNKELSMNNIYETPKSADLQVDDLKNKKPGIILIIFTVLFSVLAYSASFLNQLLATGLIASGAGGGLAPILLGGFVVGIFQIGKRFRNSRSRYKIFLWCQIIFVISLLTSLIGQFAQTAK